MVMNTTSGLRSTFAILAILVTLSCPWDLSAFVTNNVLTRLFMIKNGNDIGSAFTMDRDGRQYLVTARHLVSHVNDGDSIELLKEGRWSKYTVKRIPVDPPNADVAVLVLPSPLPGTLPTSVDGAMTLSEELYFLGFPFSLMIPGVVLDSGFHLPLVKRGIVSAFGQEDGVNFLLLDGFNNPGFSGGPIVRGTPADRPTIIGVVSGYRYVDEPVQLKGKPSDYLYRANTGIVIGIGIRHVTEAIDKNPIGPRIDAR
jgi:S1-C subfamily serine protease